MLLEKALFLLFLSNENHYNFDFGSLIRTRRPFDWRSELMASQYADLLLTGPFVVSFAAVIRVVTHRSSPGNVGRSVVWPP